MRYLRTNVKRVRVGMLKRERERVFYVLDKFYDIVNKHATMNHPIRNMEWMTFKTIMNGETVTLSQSWQQGRPALPGAHNKRQV